MNNKYIYRYTDPSRNEVIYIGQGTQGKTNGWKYKRAHCHIKRTDRHPFVRRLQKMAREGVQPVIDILIEGIDQELADLIEQEAIDKYGRKDLGKGPLLNLTDGGDGTKNMPTASRASIGESVKNRSDELKARIAKAQSASHTGNVWWTHSKTGETVMMKVSPGDEWLRGRIGFVLSNPGFVKGRSWWHHPETQQTKMSEHSPGDGWVKGRRWNGK